MWFPGDHNQFFTHWPTTVPLVSHNQINRGTEDNEGRNIMDIRKRGRECTNQKGCVGFDDGWDCCLLAIILS